MKTIDVFAKTNCKVKFYFLCTVLLKLVLSSKSDTKFTCGQWTPQSLAYSPDLSDCQSPWKQTEFELFLKSSNLWRVCFSCSKWRLALFPSMPTWLRTVEHQSRWLWMKPRSKNRIQVKIKATVNMLFSPLPACPRSRWFAPGCTERFLIKDSRIQNKIEQIFKNSLEFGIIGNSEV